MINIAEILKDCPKGTELYSPICGNCKLLKIYNGLGFDVINDADEVFNFSYDGRYNLNGECCIFPSKDKRDWNTFRPFRPFKDGDIIAKDEFIVIFSHSKQSEVKVKEQIVYYHCYLRGSSHFKSTKDCGVGYISDFRFATDEEKQKLFDVIKAFGYKWNAETKTLEKLIVPKFKAGDKIKGKNERFPSTRTIDNYVEGIGYYTTIHDWVRIEDQDNWELVPTHKFKVGDIITNGKVTIKIGHIDGDYYYDITRNIATRLFIKFQDEWELVPNKFDISTLKAYDKVLVRDTNVQVWVADLFSHVLDRPLGGYTFACVGHYSYQCIPYEGNEHLLGKCDDCDEYYKNW
ncbi:MAG: hypothetical protein J6V44_17350 [Methanobrevibacter sp.]|nr:hypothetical protein [Methanobrevibacter sp.]